MDDTAADADLVAIHKLIGRQFESMSWNASRSPDWNAFSEDFIQGGQLFASARPVKPQSVTAFVERMKSLAGTALSTFEESLLGSRIIVFGNVAVAVAACENVENGSDINRNVEMMLLVKDGGRWRIAAQCWDKAPGDDQSSALAWKEG